MEFALTVGVALILAGIGIKWVRDEQAKQKKRETIPPAGRLSSRSEWSGPEAWQRWIKDRPGIKEVVEWSMDKDGWMLVQEINDLVNKSKYTAETQGRDVWGEGRGGLHYDCDDFAIDKLIALVANGVPRDALSLATCKIPGAGYHVVLLLRTDKGHFILDNRFKDVLPVDAPGYIEWAFEAVGGWFFARVVSRD